MLISASEAQEPRGCWAEAGKRLGYVHVLLHAGLH